MKPTVIVFVNEALKNLLKRYGTEVVLDSVLVTRFTSGKREVGGSLPLCEQLFVCVIF